VKVMGVYALPHSGILLEYCKGGSLDKLLYDTSKDITNTYKMSLIKGIAMGMDHLHKANILHKDLASRNILVRVVFYFLSSYILQLDDTGNAKISDFGLSETVFSVKKDITSEKTQELLPLKTMSPEALQDREFSKASDVWSYGLLIYGIKILLSSFLNLFQKLWHEKDRYMMFLIIMLRHN